MKTRKNDERMTQHNDEMTDICHEKDDDDEEDYYVSGGKSQRRRYSSGVVRFREESP
jgi:hypothetical protein